MKIVFPIAFILALFLMACGGTEPPVSKNSDATGESVKTPASFNKVYVGILNTDSALMQLEAKDRILSGSYFYKGKTELVVLSGSLSENDSIRLEGIDAANKQMMIFNGIIKGNTFSGEWIQDKPMGNFSFTESAMEYTPEKYAVMDTLVYKMIKQENTKNKKCHCLSKYPQIANPDKITAIEKINADIKKNAIDVLDDCDGYEADANEPVYENEAICRVIFNNGEIFGVDIAGYMTGGAHPVGWTITYYYNVATGAPIKLIDLFQGSSLEKLAAIGTTKLQKKYKVKKLTEAGFSANTIPLSGDESFYIAHKNDSSFSLHFSSYDIAAYVVGPVDVDFTFSEVKPLLSNRTAFSKVIK